MNPNQTSTSCESSSPSQFSRWPQSLSQSDANIRTKQNIRQPRRFRSMFRRSRLNLKRSISAAYQGVERGLAITKTFKVNNRLYAGLFLLLVVAPFTSCIYTFFDSSVGFPISPDILRAVREGNPPEGFWYYVNWYYFFISICPHLFTVTSLVGIFLLFPVRHVPSYGIAAPLGYEVSKIIWLSTVESNAEFNQLVPLSILLSGVLLTVIVMLSARFWMDRKFHKYDGIMARIIGLIDAPGIDPDTRKKHMKTVFSELKNIH
jgi:hypothetical protein